MTQEERRANSFTDEDRAILRAVDKRTKEINGTVKRHEEEIFGDEEHGTVGLLPRVRELEITILKAQTVLRTLWFIAGFLGLTNIAVIITIWKGL